MRCGRPRLHLRAQPRLDCFRFDLPSRPLFDPPPSPRSPLPRPRLLPAGPCARCPARRSARRPALRSSSPSDHRRRRTYAHHRHIPYFFTRTPARCHFSLAPGRRHGGLARDLSRGLSQVLGRHHGVGDWCALHLGHLLRCACCMPSPNAQAPSRPAAPCGAAPGVEGAAWPGAPLRFFFACCFCAMPAPLPPPHTHRLSCSPAVPRRLPTAFAPPSSAPLFSGDKTFLIAAVMAMRYSRTQVRSLHPARRSLARAHAAF